MTPDTNLLLLQEKPERNGYDEEADGHHGETKYHVPSLRRRVAAERTFNALHVVAAKARKATFNIRVKNGVRKDEHTKL